MAGNVVSNVKKYYGGQVPVPGQGDSDGKVKVLVEKTATIEIGGVQTEVELLYDADDLTTPVTPQQLGQWTDENYLIAFKKREDDGRIRGFVLYALETDSTSTDTLVNRAEFIAFKEDMTGDPGASAYEFTMVEDSSTLVRYLRDETGEMVVKFNQATVEAGAQSGTLDELIQSDTTAIDFEVVREDGKSYLRLNTEGLSGIFDDMDADIQYIIGALDKLPSDEHGYFNSSLITTPGDGTTENIVIDDFRISQGRDVHGESIEFVPTHQEGGIDFGEVYLNPGTYIFTVHYTLQWVGNPRGTFLPLVANVGDRPFDFSYEHEDVVRTTRIVTRTTRGKFSLGFPIDADTPQIGIWVKNLEIAQIASYNHAAVAHDTTLTGTGKLDSPLGVNTPVVAQSTLAGNLVPAFDPTRTSENPYKIGDGVIYGGIVRVFSDPHYGAWSASDATVSGVDATNYIELKNRVASMFSDVLDYANPVQLSVYIENSGGLIRATENMHANVIDATSLRGKTIAVLPHPAANSGIIAFINEVPTSLSDTIKWSAGEHNRHVVLKGSVGVYRVPDDCVYLYYVQVNNSRTEVPCIYINGSNDVHNNIGALMSDTMLIRSDIPLSSLKLQRGTVTNNGGLDDGGYIVNKRVSNGGYPAYATLGQVVEYDIASGYRLAISEWDKINPITVKSGWLTGKGSHSINSCNYIFFIVSKSDDSSITIDEAVANVSAKILNSIDSLFYNTKNFEKFDDVLKYSNFEFVNPEQSPTYIDSNGVLVPPTAHYYANLVDATSLRGKYIYVSPKKNANCIVAFVNFISTSRYGSIIWSKGENARHVVVNGNIGLFRVPDDCVYLYYVPWNNDVDTTPTIKVLSGCLLQTIASELPLSEKHPVSAGEYFGEKIHLKRMFSFYIWNTILYWQNSQGGAVYGNYLVSVMACDEMPDGSVNGHIYNLATCAKVCDLIFSSTLDGTTYSLPHANCVCFGKDFYNSNSVFPLLYVSQVNGGNSDLWNASERGVLVYDLQSDGNGGFTPVLVQVIKPDLSTPEKVASIEAKIGKYTPNYVIDTDKGCMYVLGYPRASWFDGYADGMPVAKLPLYSITDGPVITFDDDDVIDNYRMEMKFAIQQPLYMGGKIYIQGGTAYSARGIQVLDLEKKCRVTLVDTTDAHSGEPQFIGMYDNKLLWYDAGTSGKIYEVKFD